MVEISDRTTARQSLLAQLLNRRREQASADLDSRFGKKGYEPKGREIHDTVQLSDGAKIVNLARGLDLARDIRAEKDPAKVREMVASGSTDIKRIGRLFTEVARSVALLFRGFRF